MNPANNRNKTPGKAQKRKSQCKTPPNVVKLIKETGLSYSSLSSSSSSKSNASKHTCKCDHDCSCPSNGSKHSASSFHSSNSGYSSQKTNNSSNSKNNIYVSDSYLDRFSRADYKKRLEKTINF